jgi:hypothetical protein
VKKSFYFVQSMSQFSMIKISFFSEKLGANLSNRRDLEYLFSFFVKKQQRQKFQQKKKRLKRVQKFLFLLNLDRPLIVL